MRMRDPFGIINKITEIATKEIKCVNIDLGYGFTRPVPLHASLRFSLSLSKLHRLHPQILLQVNFLFPCFRSFFLRFIS